jgi:anaerobic magnesium-protoporphyrin IX monomethyl ester cyclase
VEALRKAGAQAVWIGAESGSQKILDGMEKGTRIEQIHEAARLLQEAGIKVGFFLQFGYPGETRADIHKTIQMVRDCDPDDIGISVSYPLPGTKFYQAVKLQLGARQNWQDSSDLAMLYQGSYSTAFYRKLHTVVHKEFRSRKAWQTLRSKPSLRQAARLLYHSLTLPVARWQLGRLAGRNNLPVAIPHMSHEQAARPTPQESE